MRRLALVIAMLVAAPATLAAPALSPSSTTRASVGSVPVLAYYYIWFDEASWNRAKTDYPILGRYSSDDKAVMEQHIRWAKSVGIEGFIVSWKSTPRLDARLNALVEVAASNDFKLAIIYQALDFSREPISIDDITRDLAFFADRWGTNPVFGLFERPMVILSGTWEFSPIELQIAIGKSRDRLLVLASERSAEEYRRVDTLFDGDAYYWSSVNPDADVNHTARLIDLATAVHARDGLWIAPAAPGFDARLVGGRRVVDRKDGDTLRAEVGAALESSPDALGVISWNEFSENSHIEPSTTYAGTALETLAELTGRPAPGVFDLGSDDVAPTSEWIGFDQIVAFGALLATMLLATLVIARRNARGRAGSASTPRDAAGSSTGNRS
ncbi:MAG: hypothetical protein ABIR64_08125 [Candidatus Limnocylindrales bacterium]